MNRLEFMQRLEQLLSDISQKEKEEALQYYNDYLNDAGVENEQEVIESLGSPEKVARTIKEGLGDGDAGGIFTENGFEDSVSAEEKKNEVIPKVSFSGESNEKTAGSYQSSYYKTPYEKKEKGKEEKKLSGGAIAAIVILCILASPLLVSVAGIVIGLVVGIAGGILGLFVGVAATGIGLFLAAIILIVIGIGQLFHTPVIGICLLGVGLLLAGISLLFIWLTVWLCGTAIPFLVRKTVELFSRLFHKKGGEKI